MPMGVAKSFFKTSFKIALVAITVASANVIAAPSYFGSNSGLRCEDLFAPLTAPLTAPLSASQGFAQRVSRSLTDKGRALKKDAAIYANNVVESHGRSIILVDAKPTSVEGQKLGGLLTPAETNAPSYDLAQPFRPLLQALPRHLSRAMWGTEYDLTPFRAVDQNLIRPPIHYLTKKLFGRAFEMSIGLSIAMNLALGYWAWNEYDDITRQMILARAAQEMNANADFYDSLLNDDIRFVEIRAELKKMGVASTTDLHAFTAKFRQLQSDYFDYMKEQYLKDYQANPAKTNRALMESQRFGIFFDDIAHLYNVGVQPGLPNFFYLPNFKAGPLSEAQADRLMKNRHFSLHKEEFIIGAVLKSKNAQQLMSYPGIEMFYDTQPNRAFFSQAVSLYQAGKISRHQLTHALQMDAFWEDRLESYQSLGLVPRSRNERGQLTNLPLSEDMIRQELLNNALSSEPSRASSPH